jgi:hypothetical protein
MLNCCSMSGGWTNRTIADGAIGQATLSQPGKCRFAGQHCGFCKSGVARRRPRNSLAELGIRSPAATWCAGSSQMPLRSWGSPTMCPPNSSGIPIRTFAGSQWKPSPVRQMRGSCTTTYQSSHHCWWTQIQALRQGFSRVCSEPAEALPVCASRLEFIWPRGIGIWLSRTTRSDWRPYSSRPFWTGNGTSS